MQGNMIDLWKYRATSEERNFIERNQGSNFLGGGLGNR